VANDGMLPSARKDRQTATRDWDRVGPTIDGVTLKHSRHIATANSLTTEAFRSDWPETGSPTGHVIHVAMDAGRLSAWHTHRIQTDGIFVLAGRMLLVLHDRRPDSPTNSRTMSLRLDGQIPLLVRIPPMVWHGVKPLLGPASFLNIISHPYNYEDPDEWRLPPDTEQIPFDIVQAQ
jgi:dTDP-4-dehydrorhamnose 3,5-epimerase